MFRRRSAGMSLLVFLITMLVLVVISRCCDQAEVRGAAGLPTGRAVVLMYHHVLPEAQVGKYAGNSIVTTAEAFKQQLDWLCAEGFTTVTPAALDAFLYDGDALPEKAVLITFDDGYLSNAEIAYPLLKERGMCATVFLVTGHLAETRQRFDPRLVQMLDAETIQETADVFTYACHTHDLHTVAAAGVSTLSAATEGAAEDDLARSLAVLQEIPGADLTVFSYPYGLRSDNAMAALRQDGFRLAFIASGGIVTPHSDPLVLPRCPVDSSVSLKTFQGYFSGILSVAS